jgi:hypothetical protein
MNEIQLKTIYKALKKIAFLKNKFYITKLGGPKIFLLRAALWLMKGTHLENSPKTLQTFKIIYTLLNLY